MLEKCCNLTPHYVTDEWAKEVNWAFILLENIAPTNTCKERYMIGAYGC